MIPKTSKQAFDFFKEHGLTMGLTVERGAPVIVLYGPHDLHCAVALPTNFTEQILVPAILAIAHALEDTPCETVESP